MSISINTDIWGTPETWISIGATGAAAKVADFPRIPGYMETYRKGTLIGGYLNDDIDLENIDETICPWAIGKNADFLKGQFWLINPDGTNDLSPDHLNPVIQNFSFTDVARRNAFPFFLGRHENAGYRGYHHAHDSLETMSSAADRQSWFDTSPYPTVYSNYGVAPFLTFNYNKLLCKPIAIFITEYNKTDFDALFTNGYKDNGTSSPEYTTTSYAIEDITDEILNNYYCVGVYFCLYGEMPNPGDDNTMSTYAFSILEKDAFPALDTVSGGIFGEDQHFPVTILGNSWGQHRQGCLLGDLFAEMQTGSSNSAVYTAANFANLPDTTHTQPKFWGGSSEKWEYYGYISIRGNFYSTWSGNYCYPIFVWNGGNAATFKSYIMEQAAYLGFIFTDSDSRDVWNKKGGWDGSGENEYLPLFDSSGYTTGQYVHGSAALEQPNSSWGNDVWEKTNYQGTPPAGDPNEYDTRNKTELNLQYTQMMMRFCKGYLLTKAQVDALSVKCYDIGHDLGSAPDIVQEMLTKLFLKDGDPMDMIISLMFFPFNPAKYFVNVPQSEEIFFGAYPTGITAKRWDNLIVEIDMGSCTFYPTMGDSIDDFRNYQPYTTAELQLPYIGSVDIDPHIYLGHKISVKYVVDLCTGSCQALIYRDSLVVDQISGHIGSAVSVKGVDQLEQLTAQQRAQANLKQARNTQISNVARMGITAAAAVGSVLTGGTLGVALGAGAIGGASNLIHSQNSSEQAEYEVDHIQTPYREIGHASSITAYRGEQFCRLIIKRPRMDAAFSPSNYAHTTGYATLSTATLSQFSGYTVCSSADLSGITATDQELNAIAAALRAGVYL